MRSCERPLLGGIAQTPLQSAYLLSALVGTQVTFWSAGSMVVATRPLLPVKPSKIRTRSFKGFGRLMRKTRVTVGATVKIGDVTPSGSTVGEPPTDKAVTITRGNCVWSSTKPIVSVGQALSEQARMASSVGVMVSVTEGNGCSAAGGAVYCARPVPGVPGSRVGSDTPTLVAKRRTFAPLSPCAVMKIVRL